MWKSRMTGGYICMRDHELRNALHEPILSGMISVGTDRYGTCTWTDGPREEVEIKKDVAANDLLIFGITQGFYYVSIEQVQARKVE